MLYAYGAVRPGHAAPDVRGIDGAPVEVVEAAGLGVAVSELARDVEPTRDRLVQHHRVTMALLRGGGVAPFRFGNVFPGEAELRQGLQKRASELGQMLETLAGYVEMCVRLPLPNGGKPGSGTEYLLHKKRQLHAADQLHSELAELVQDWREEVRGNRLSVACLVPQARAAEFERKATQVDARAEVSGPWPPSSFV
jgi:hypothetical protein